MNSERNGGVVLAAPYPEGAIMQLARHAEAFRNPVTTYLPSRALSLAASRVAGRGEALEGRLTRGSSDLPGVRMISPMLEPIRLVGKVPVLRRVFPSNMVVLKKLFDSAVARHIDDRVGSVIGMPGGCLSTFRRPVQGNRVFHAVDAHPAAVNRLLRHHYGEAAQREMVTPRQVQRIDEELELADVVLVPSVLVGDQMVAEGVMRDRIRLVPYGVNFGLFAPDSTAVSSSVPRILYVGQISYRKGLPFLLAAVRNLPVQLDLVGPVVAPELLRNLPSNVNYRGIVGHSELPSIFNNSDALVLPSVEDAFALVVAEALGAGLPVITTEAVGSSVLLNGDQDGHIVAAGEADALRSALRDVSPLEPQSRAERAARHRASDGRVTSWADYASAVARAIGEAG